MKFSILTLIILINSFKIFSQPYNESFKSALMPMKGGAEIVYSSNSHSLTLDIIAQKIKPQRTINTQVYLDVDNKVFQSILIGNSALKKVKNTEDEEKTQLLAYMQYELDYAKNDLKLDYTNLVHDFVYVNNKLFLSWYYDMPKKDNQSATTKLALKQINLSSICFEHILNLSTPYLQDDDFDADKGLLNNVSKTLKLNDFRLDFQEVYKKLNDN